VPHAALKAQADYCNSALRPAMSAVRAVADQLEERVPNWPLPSVTEMTSSHHF